MALIMRAVYFQTFNDVPAGKQVVVSGMAMTYNEDRIRGGNQAFLFIKFFDASWNALFLGLSLIQWMQMLQRING